MKYSGGPILIKCPACAVTCVCPVRLEGHGPKVEVSIIMDAWRLHARLCKSLAEAGDGNSDGNSDAEGASEEDAPVGI